jgi:hypothetical protein
LTELERQTYNWCLDEHKGLMELIVLNIGLELKVLTPEVFTMMVMALVTTFMTGPALDLINYLFKSKVVPDAEEITRVSTEYYFHLVTTRKASPYCD